MTYLSVGISILIGAVVGTVISRIKIRRLEKCKYKLLTGLYRFISERDKDSMYDGY